MKTKKSDTNETQIPSKAKNGVCIGTADLPSVNPAVGIGFPNMVTLEMEINGRRISTGNPTVPNKKNAIDQACLDLKLKELVGRRMIGLEYEIFYTLPSKI